MSKKNTLTLIRVTDDFWACKTCGNRFSKVFIDTSAKQVVELHTKLHKEYKRKHPVKYLIALIKGEQ